MASGFWVLRLPSTCSVAIVLERVYTTRGSFFEKASEMRITSGIVTTVGEALELVHKGLSFPILVIPVPESFGLTNHIVQHEEQLETAVTEALKESCYSNPPKVHIISRAGWGKYWMEYRKFKPVFLFEASATSGIVTTVGETLELVHRGLSFPILVIPVPENFWLTNHIVQNTSQLEGAVEEALVDSCYCNPSKVHVISRAGWLPISYWGAYRKFKPVQK